MLQVGCVMREPHKMAILPKACQHRAVLLREDAALLRELHARSLLLLQLIAGLR